MEKELKEAIYLRENCQYELALQKLQNLWQKQKDNPVVNYQIAWTYDNMGNESAAVSFYEAAIDGNLQQDRKGAFVGLGSTYRCLREYQKSLSTFERAEKEFPEDRAIKVFKALTLYDLGHHGQCVQEILRQLLETTTDSDISSYNRALAFYAQEFVKEKKDD